MRRDHEPPAFCHCFGRERIRADIRIYTKIQDLVSPVVAGATAYALNGRSWGKSRKGQTCWAGHRVITYDRAGLRRLQPAQHRI